jgi:hypothetical protein
LLLILRGKVVQLLVHGLVLGARRVFDAWIFNLDNIRIEPREQLDAS